MNQEWKSFCEYSIEFATKIKNAKVISCVALKDDAYLAITKIAGETTAFVVYVDNTVFSLSDWRESYPTNEKEISEYSNWLLCSREGDQKAVLSNGLPRQLVELSEYGF
ncbi:MAG: hypothetical protein LKE54_07320 [Prevotella sp.]|jgi:hypothetical protein|nr:hypothetical protein [Prevotella sp.]MCH3994843.1 hypothetical protein [Prevotella sp.]